MNDTAWMYIFEALSLLQMANSIYLCVLLKRNQRALEMSWREKLTLASLLYAILGDASVTIVEQIAERIEGEK